MDSIKGFLKTTFLASAIMSADVLHAQDIDLHGFVQANYSLRIADTEGRQSSLGGPLPDYLLGDERLQLELSRFGTRASLLGKVDFFHDGIDKRADVDLREAYVDLQLGSVDVRAGRQIITWGVGDLVFINDVFPKDWTAFLSGRPLEYLKFGSDGVNVNLYSGAVSAQVVAIPFFQPDILPTGERLVAFNPFPSATARIEERPLASYKNTELALRLYRYVGPFDVSLYAYRGFFGSPRMQFDSAGGIVTISYSRLRVYGASAQGAFLNGVLSLEGGYYDSADKDFSFRRDPTIENDQVRYLAGYQRAFGEDFTAGFQYYGEWIQDYSQYVEALPLEFPRREEVRHVLSLRLTQFLKYQTVRLSFFTFYSPNEEDYYFNPEVHLQLGDGIGLSAGALVFDGKKGNTFFGQFEKNDNAYVVLRYSF